MSIIISPTALDPLLGKVLDGKYRVQRALGEGGMAHVYLAQHLGLEHPVAIKFLKSDLAREPDIAERFAREARTIAQLDNEHIVKVLDVGRDEDAGPYMVMEYLDGEDVQMRLEREGPCSLEQAARIIIEAAIGLNQAHARGIVHRDLKPENLFLARSQQGVEIVKLLDFGISKVTDASVSKLTQPQVALGSPNYMAPEQLTARDDVDARADVWSLGVVLYQLTTGQLPFHGSSMSEVYAKVLYGQPLAPSSYRPELPRAFDALVLRCLSKQPSARPRSVASLARALRACLSGDSRGRVPTASAAREGTPSPLAVTTRITIASFSRGRRLREVSALAALALAALGTLAVAIAAFSEVDRETPGLVSIPPTTRIEPLRAAVADTPPERALSPRGPSDDQAREPPRSRVPARRAGAKLPPTPASQLNRVASREGGGMALRTTRGPALSSRASERVALDTLSDFGGRR